MVNLLSRLSNRGVIFYQYLQVTFRDFWENVTSLLLNYRTYGPNFKLRILNMF